ncbi:uncharacterized protein N7473_001749 [Penicillium subrubescens]|uniref:uncharacterized protein n=1 Tax=Penicillium subrubescens TaxID=1316194 RepID=UPI0025459FFF|nr:uncharacterized protein N7473_001749 [Penicillium subrubescens]KAJ5904833.1 hypothetical protein N7473_001749 [Penicillium subrubescens]
MTFEILGNVSNISRPLGQDLRGKTALVTGATRGIGRAIAFHLASRGASILGTFSSPESAHRLDELNRTVLDLYRGLEGHAPKIVGVAANVLSLDSPRLIKEALIGHFEGKVNIVINNAAYDPMRAMGKLDDDYVQKVLMGNTHALVMLMDALYANNIIQPNSRIINISSESGRRIPFPEMYLVGATKATMEALTRSWADILGTNSMTMGTTVNALLVGATATDTLLREAPTSFRQKATDARQSGSNLIDGVALPEDIANVAGLLVSERANWVTGSVVCANGGKFKIL